MSRRRAIRFGVSVLVAVAGLSSLLADETLYYEMQGRALVITNTPSRATRPLPEWDGRPESLPAPGSLPATRFDVKIAAAARAAGLAPSLVKAVAWAESGFDPRAVSPKGALGLMQLMPATASSYGVTQPFDPEQNLRAGARHLRKLIDQFEGDLTLALAAYNAGAGTVRRHGGVPNYRETKNYVNRVQSRLTTSRPVRATTPTGTVLSSGTESLKMSRRSDGTVMISN